MKRTEGIKEQMIALLEARGEVSAAEFREAMPGVSEQTVFSRVRALERAGLVYKSGRGKYSLGVKPEYVAGIFPRMWEINAILIKEFVGASLCISSADGDNVLIETDRKELDRMLLFLRSGYTGVYSFREAVMSRDSLKDAIIVKPMVSNSPVVVTDGMATPSIEKVLVDIVADEAFFRMDEEAIRKEYQRALEVYPVNKNRILRYAGRRNLGERVASLMDSVDKTRIETISKIQEQLSRQPVLRAWLFGSWSRMEEGPGSDIDILVDFDKSAHVSLLDHVGFQQDIEAALSKSVDYVTNGSLLPFAARTANAEKYLIYERRT